MLTPRGMRSSAPYAAAECERQAAEQRRHRGHDDGPETQQACLEDGLFRRFAFFAFGLKGEVDHHDGILLHDADEQNDADQRDDAEFNPGTA